MSLFEVIVAIFTAGIVYALAKAGTYLLMSKIELENLDIIWSKLPDMLHSAAKYLNSKKCKKTWKELEKAVTGLMSETVVKVDLEPDQEED